MQVEQIMTRSPACCYPDTPVEEVARLMTQRNCGMIPVVDSAVNMQPLGVITDRDITCRTVALARDPMGMTAREVMTIKPLTVRPFDQVHACVQLMELNDVRRVLVIDETGRCIGVVAQADIARTAPATEVAELVRDISMGQTAAAAAIL